MFRVIKGEWDGRTWPNGKVAGDEYLCKCAQGFKQNGDPASILPNLTKKFERGWVPAYYLTALKSQHEILIFIPSKVNPA